jgi:hypothetical protein
MSKLNSYSEFYLNGRYAVQLSQSQLRYRVQTYGNIDLS